MVDEGMNRHHLSPGTIAFAEACQKNDKRPLIYRISKRACDIVLSACICILGLIPGLIIAIVIALETKGSPIYSQKRVGRLGKPFRLYKFRSMVADADNVFKYFTPEQLDEWKRERKVQNDPRVTPFGQFIRRTSIDEFPQFLNVLFGSLSVVGPRAITYEELQNYTDDEKVILLSVPQGVTGYWQVTERNNATWSLGLRQKLELSYVSQCSLKFDFEIIFSTFSTMLRKTGR